jgi:CDP-diacylglycerol--glycerol-3-phosphate 3-phosphatidyltransferase
VTLANRITFFRLALIPVFCLLIFCYTESRDYLRFAALGVYLLAAISDGMDGYIARHWDQQTQLGVRLDPMADKLLVNLGLVFLAANESLLYNIPRWFPVFVLTRDVAIVLIAYAIHQRKGTVHVQPSMLGKLTTVVQFCTLIAVLLQWPAATYFMWATVLLTFASGMGYLQAAIYQIRTPGAAQ